jgi:tripartite-type tricarboxylate transporter receptor subunit TctC
VKSRGQDWLRDGKIKILVQMGIAKADDLPDVPLAIDLAKTPEDKDAMTLIFSPTYIGWPSVMPPNVPAERVQAVRAAYDQAMRDPGLIATAEKQDLELDPVRGGEIQEIVTRLYKMPPTVIERARVAMTTK